MIPHPSSPATLGEMRVLSAVIELLAMEAGWSAVLHAQHGAGQFAYYSAVLAGHYAGCLLDADHRVSRVWGSQESTS